MRKWNISTHENGNLVINLVCDYPAHLLNMVALGTLSAAELSRALHHLETAADDHARAVLGADYDKVMRISSGSQIKGSLTVTAADGTDITQPPAPAEDAAQ